MKRTKKLPGVLSPCGKLRWNGRDWAPRTGYQWDGLKWIPDSPVGPPAVPPPPPKPDPVDHPPHYTAHPSGVECITVTEHFGFNLGNAIKYIWRADLKGDALEDLRKAKWYLEREIAKRSGGKPNG